MFSAEDAIWMRKVGKTSIAILKLLKKKPATLPEISKALKKKMEYVSAYMYRLMKRELVERKATHFYYVYSITPRGEEFLKIYEKEVRQ
jgi:predicted transcriptional regulator